MVAAGLLAIALASAADPERESKRGDPPPPEGTSGKAEEPEQMRVALLPLPGADSSRVEAALERCLAGDFHAEPLPDSFAHRPPEGPHYRDLGFLEFGELGPPHGTALDALARASEDCAVIETSAGPAIARRMVYYGPRTLSEGEIASAREHERRRTSVQKLRDVTIPAAIASAGLDLAAIPASAEADRIALAGGVFWMGSTEAEIDQRVELYERYVAATVGPAERRRYEDELLHPVRVEPLAVDRTEVSAGVFRAFAERAGYRHEAQLPTDDSLPATGVTLADAIAFCAAAGGRVPTAEEWEFAARGVGGRRFPWGDELPDGTRGNFCDSRCDQGWATPDHDDGNAGGAPVGSYPAGATPEGVLDLAGNAREWTATLTEDGKAWVKGGGFRNAYDDMISADVRVQEWDRRSPDVGFRCVSDGD
jgi:formylglycine-generating enzyme required for sulfatase activity